MKGFYALVCAVLIIFYANNLIAHGDFVSVIAASKPCVVIVEVTRKKSFLKPSDKKNREKVLGKHNDFFEQGFSELSPQRTGSGFVVSNDGYVLTAAHVVKGAGKVWLTFLNGEKVRADLVRTDTSIDLALLKVRDVKGPLPTLMFSNVEPIEGQPVLAMGAALGLRVSSSVGIISALEVNFLKHSKVALLQTDASINPGSSGGPLLDLGGNVIGLVSKIYSKTGTFSGAAFAVPSAKLNAFINQ